MFVMIVSSWCTLMAAVVLAADFFYNDRAAFSANGVALAALCTAFLFLTFRTISLAMTLRRELVALQPDTVDDFFNLINAYLGGTKPDQVTRSRLAAPAGSKGLVALLRSYPKDQWKLDR